jgi:hypothetical protein
MCIASGDAYVARLYGLCQCERLERTTHQNAGGAGGVQRRYATVAGVALCSQYPQSTGSVTVGAETGMEWHPSQLPQQRVENHAGKTYLSLKPLVGLF